MGSLIIILIFVIFSAFITFFTINARRIKGAIGESRVSRQLSTLQEGKYIVINDLLLKTDKGSSQIDHVVISIYGIFVIESKMYSGWIHGNEDYEYWTQTI